MKMSIVVCNKEIVKVTIDTIRRGVVGGTYHPQLVWAILAQEPVGFDPFRLWPIWLGGERPPGIRYQASGGKPSGHLATHHRCALERPGGGRVESGQPTSSLPSG